MTTRILKAQVGNITEEMKQVAKKEGISAKALKDLISQGRVVILKNKNKKDLTPVAIGEGLKTKISANIATHYSKSSFEEGLDKLRVAQIAGADCILDLSVGSFIEQTRQNFITNSKTPIGTSPMLQLGYEASQDEDGIVKLSKNDFLNIIKKHCVDGVDFVCLHCTLTRNLVELFKEQNRLSKITSRSAQMLYDWINLTEFENPYYQNFDEVLNILKEYDVTLFLASAFKSGSISDSFDSLQISEYAIMSSLIKKAHQKGVQVVSDGIGHISMDKIPSSIKLIKETTLNIPLFVSSAASCDCAIGYDNISTSIANSICAQNGANMINSTTSVDYLYLSNVAQIREGIICAKIAAHSADIANGLSEATKQDYKISFARANTNWKNIIKNSIDKTVFDGLNLKTIIDGKK